MISFENTRTAFRVQSDRDLKRAHFLFKLISYPWLVKLGNPLIRFASVLRLPIGWIVKPTVYQHFVGGETLESCLPVVDKLKSGGVYSILDYSVEGKESDKEIEAALEETLRAIDFAAANPHIPFAVFKPTAFARSEALEILSGTGIPGKGEITEGQKFRERINTLCSRAHQHNIPILIDAEDSYYQPFIDSVVMDMMETFNRIRAIVFNTYQMYRHDRLGRLKDDHERAGEQQFFLGAKFVRGAYMEKERERAQKMGYEDPIQPDKESTDRDYNLALKYSVEHIDRIAVFNGTHNEDSSRYMAELMTEHKLAPDDQRLWFSQLYGMSDHISFNLAREGYNVVKYVPYGPIRHVLPYLLRRVEENTSVKGQTSRELYLIARERKRRRGGDK